MSNRNLVELGTYCKGVGGGARGPHSHNTHEFSQSKIILVPDGGAKIRFYASLFKLRWFISDKFWNNRYLIAWHHGSDQEPLCYVQRGTWNGRKFQFGREKQNFFLAWRTRNCINLIRIFWLLGSVHLRRGSLIYVSFQCSILPVFATDSKRLLINSAKNFPELKP